MLAIVTRIASQIKVDTKLKLGNKLILFFCQITSLILFTFCAILTSQQYFGKPIQCIQDVNSDSASIPERVMNTFCFISYTYSSVEFKDNGAFIRTSENIKKHSYYPWVPILTFLQGLTFMVPVFLGSVNDNSYLAQYLKEANLYTKKDIIPQMAKYISNRLNDFRSWSASNLLSEIAFAINIVGNFAITDTFLGGQFMDYGYEALLNKKIYGETIFPKMTKCSFHKYGPSGSIEHRDALCLMTLNIINENFYIFLWFWFLLLLLASAFVLIQRLFYIIFLVFRKPCKIVIKKLFANHLSQGEFEVLIRKLSFSDWLLLEQIKSQLDLNLYIKLLEKIVHEISEPHDLISNGLEVFTKMSIKTGYVVMLWGQ